MMSNRYKEYTNQDLKLMLELKNHGLTYKQIAEKFDRTWHGVKKAIQRYKKYLSELKQNETAN